MFTLASGEPAPAASTAQMREVDRSMAGHFGIDLARMMENAGRNLADLGQLLFAPRAVIVLAGPGGNGDGGLVAARHLHNRGVTVSIVLAGGPLAPVTAQQASIVHPNGHRDPRESGTGGPGSGRHAWLRAARGPPGTVRRADRPGRRPGPCSLSTGQAA
jgi:hypothetical protein